MNAAYLPRSHNWHRIAVSAAKKKNEKKRIHTKSIWIFLLLLCSNNRHFIIIIWKTICASFIHFSMAHRMKFPLKWILIECVCCYDKKRLRFYFHWNTLAVCSCHLQSKYVCVRVWVIVCVCVQELNGYQAKNCHQNSATVCSSNNNSKYSYMTYLNSRTE